jgi:lysophospholipase L1-like esterase
MIRHRGVMMIGIPRRLPFWICGGVLAVTALGADSGGHWIGTWAASAQHWTPGRLQSFRNQTLRLIVHASIGGKKPRVKIANTYGEQPLRIAAVHIARRTSGADIDSASDRSVTFHGQNAVTIPPRSIAVSDAVDFDVPALSDLAISLFFADTALATTTHALAQQTNYVSPETGDSTADAKFTVARTIAAWPFLTAVDVVAPDRGFAIVALGSSLTDGDGATKDANKRWPDVLAERLQKCAAKEAPAAVLNEGIIGNRLLSDWHSPRQNGGPFGAVYEDLGPALGESGLARFDRDVLQQSGVKFVILGLGINDILFPGAFIPASEAVSAQKVMAADRELSRRAHKNGLKVIITTLPACEGAFFREPLITFCGPREERVRQEVNSWIRSTKEFDGMIDFDEPVRDPNHPSRILPEYDSGDHLHPNDAGYVATGRAIPLKLFGCGEDN